jgi:Cof subfamily protein (haloacid dehalogenase superfamily)
MTLSRRSPPLKISAVVSDVDGTLVTDDKVLTARAKAAGAELRAHGIAFAIISGRPPRGLRMLIDSLTITTPVGCFNGGVIVKPDLSVIGEHLLLPQVARRAVAMLDASGAQAWIFAGQDWVTRDGDGPYTGLEERTIGFGPTIVEDFGPALDVAAKIVGVSADHELLARCERDVRGKLADGATVARSQVYYLDITPPLANKGAGLRELSKLLSIPLTEIAVIGDGRNDVAMFEEAGFSIAMGNASAEVKRAADCATDSNHEDGFANAIQRYILGGEHPNARVERAPAGESAC